MLLAINLSAYWLVCKYARTGMALFITNGSDNGAAMAAVN